MLTLGHAWVQECLAAAPMVPAQRTGVYVGAMWAHEFVEVLPQLGLSQAAANSSTGNTAPFLVGRISYSFGLQVSWHARQSRAHLSFAAMSSVEALCWSKHH